MDARLVRRVIKPSDLPAPDAAADSDMDAEASVAKPARVVQPPGALPKVPDGFAVHKTGFVVDNDSVWGRPAGVAVTRDGALLVSDDANGTISRVSRR